MESIENVQIDIGKACAIDGWMAVPELEFLASQARVNKRIIELGSFLGRSTRALADNTEGKVLAIDHWRGPNDVEIAGREFLFESFVENLKDRIDSGVCIPWNIDHRDIDARLACVQMENAWGTHSADMIFIDGDHSYSAVHQDISNFLPLLEPGGLLCGHDYNFNYPGLLKAVLELVPGDPKPAPGTDIWYWQKP